MNTFTRLPASETAPVAGPTPGYTYRFMRAGPHAQRAKTKNRPAPRLVAWEGEGGSLDEPAA